METILVTGGAGFIGSHTCEALLKAKNRVCIVDSLNDFYNPDIKRENLKQVMRTAEDNGGHIQVYTDDICDLSAMRKIFEENRIKAVIHLAAYAGVRPSIENPDLYTRVNINGTVNLLECMKEFGVNKLLFASSSSVYGNNKKVPFSESHSVDHPISPYAATKKAGELICYTYHHLYHINTACLRFFTVYGPRQRPDLAIHKFTRLMYGENPISIFGDGTMKRDFTYIDDIVSGILGALDWVDSTDRRYEVFNLGESRSVSVIEMIETLERETGITANKKYQPEQPGDVKITYGDISKAKELLGYAPQYSFETGIHNFIEWYKTSNKVQ